MSRSGRNGFTLLELLVVIAIIAILIGMTLPATRRVGDAAYRTRCQNNLKQLMLAMHHYESLTGSWYDSQRSFPRGCIGPGTLPEDRLGWTVELLPYLEQEPLYRKFQLQAGYQANAQLASNRINEFLCPKSSPSFYNRNPTNYVAIGGLGLDSPQRPADAVGIGFMGYDRLTTFASLKDGTSTTIALMETSFETKDWLRGGMATVRGVDLADLPVLGLFRPFGGHNKGMNLAFADGSTRFVHDEIDSHILAAAITIAGGESVSFD